MANKKDTKKRIDATIKTTPANVVDVFVDYAVQEQIKAADVPPRKRLDISFSDASKIGDNKSDTNQEAYEKAHGKLYNMTHNNTIPWRNYVAYLVIITMLTCCFTYSKYLSNATGNGTVSVAKFNVVTSSAVNSNDFTVVSNQSISSLDFKENVQSTKTIKIKISSTSDVPVNVVIKQTNNNFTGSFDGNSTFNLPASQNGKEVTNTITYSISTPNVPASATLDSAGYYNLGSLNFSISINQTN